MAHAGVDERVFQAFDRDGDGTLSQRDLELAIGAVGAEVQAETLDLLVGEAGGLSLEGLRGVVDDPSAGRGGEDLLALAFDLCGGRDANGAIGRDALGAGLRKLGLGCTEEEVLELMKEFDLDGDGKLCEEELAALVGV